MPSTSQSLSDQSGTTNGSPFPPLEHSASQTPGSLAPSSAITSTPNYGSRSRSLGRSRTELGRSGTRELGNSTRVSSTKWQTPGEMSRSFSGEEILQDDDLGSERSVPLNDASAVCHNRGIMLIEATEQIRFCIHRDRLLNWEEIGYQSCQSRPTQEAIYIRSISIAARSTGPLDRRSNDLCRGISRNHCHSYRSNPKSNSE